MYFSERELGGPSRDCEEFGSAVWRGLIALIQKHLQENSFGAQYPEICEDGTWVCGVDRVMFGDAMQAEIPNLAITSDNYSWEYSDSIFYHLRRPDRQPSTLVILDLIEFCWKSIGKPTRRRYHDFFSHDHLEFDIETGQEEFRNQVETILRRNGIAYTLSEEGRIQRLTSPVLQDALNQLQTNTGDAELDRLLGTAQRKFLNPNPVTRREALESLWDAWERLKTLDGSGDKKTQVEIMLDKTAGHKSPKFRDVLESDALELTKIGNSLRIRHSETNQEMIAMNEHVDYLFHRLSSLIELILCTR